MHDKLARRCSGSHSGRHKWGPERVLYPKAYNRKNVSACKHQCGRVRLRVFTRNGNHFEYANLKDFSL